MGKQEITQDLDFFRSTLSFLFLSLSHTHNTRTEYRCPLPSLCVTCSFIFSIQTTGLLKMGLSCQSRGRGLETMYGIHPHQTAPHRTSWTLDVSLWLQRDALIKVDGRVLHLPGDACWILVLGRGRLSAATDRADFTSPPAVVPPHKAWPFWIYSRHF